MEGQDASPIAYVNGKRHVLPQGEGHASLLSFLRGASRGKLSPTTYKRARNNVSNVSR